MREPEKPASSFLEGLCIYRTMVFILFVISFVMLLLSLVSFGVVESGTETYVIVVVNLVGLSVFCLVSGLVLVRCRDEEHPYSP